MPSRKTLTNKLVNDKNDEIKIAILTYLSKTSAVALSADMWTSIATPCYLYGKLKSAVLSTKEISENHTSEVIAGAIRSVMIDSEINEKAFAIVTDNATVMTQVARRLDLKYLGCVAHSLN